MKPNRVLVGDARNSFDEAPIHPRAQRDRAAVRANRDLVTGGNPTPLGVGGRERNLGGGSLELELGDPLDLGARKQRPVREKAQLGEDMLVSGHGASGDGAPDELGGGATYGARSGERGLIAQLLERQAVVELLGELVEDDRGVR